MHEVVLSFLLSVLQAVLEHFLIGDHLASDRAPRLVFGEILEGMWAVWRIWGAF
jgi:hypothetical protein